MAGLRTWGRRINRTLAIAVVLGVTGGAGWLVAINWHPSITSFPRQGLDVSAEQGDIEWPTVRAGGATFAYARATMGAAERDERFADNWHMLYEAGLQRGAIHVYSLCRLAADQANNFITTVPRSGDALPAAVSIDLTPDCPSRPSRAVLVGEIRRFLAMVESHTGKPMLLQVSPAIERAYRLTAAIPRPVWSAQNFFPPDFAARPWRMWRANDMRHVDGVAVPVGWDVMAR